ncbi:NAD(P)-dependent dehydrogenase, short-chain alcohol dehydrogenase family [Halogranum amylolyticum]|uniref:NAD(P)-dependent dehydrogenase, short-chain alcohol dehydrogenase family n=1 Tax=Halogranum amylolyticum TaxID=660520 RepID=A0A1H8PQN3_9EURY|nr:SDR family oxidoreductase [Halogranum amylolyticum]SEO44349.1 NAD(P)-dependent dehydrogenase, short-chain alcohol dehydrogenase family [Halogranum amylolyticum]
MTSSDSLDGTVVLLTGGTSGLGAETARTLADRGASLAVVGRDRARGEDVAADVAERNGDGWSEFYRADLASQASVRRLAARFRDRHDRLDVLVNNAGIHRSRRTETDDGVESTLAVNHLAPYLLTHDLADLLVDSAPARVVTVSSGIHTRASMEFSNLQSERDYDGMQAYARSKLANLLFTYELADRLGGTGVVATAVNPGFVPSTGLTREASLRTRLLFGAFKRLPLPFTKDVKAGAETLIRAAVDPDLADVTGAYLSDGEVTESSDASYDEVARRRLWDVSAGLVGVSPDWRLEDSPTVETGD